LAPDKKPVTAFKDHFSSQPENYQKYRPRYPDSLYQWLASLTPATDMAWDCATGNGQAALPLAGYFRQVIATDGSEQQVKSAIKADNIHYDIARETCDRIEDSSTDLVAVAQALHWFDRPVFFREVARVLKPAGILAIWSYNLLQIEPGIDQLVSDFYHQTVGKYWPAERQLVEQAYGAITLPFESIATPDFEMSEYWQREQLIGYINTWSAVKRYREDRGSDPLPELENRLRALWPDEKHLAAHWPLTVKVSRKPQ
jgi:ubiquinone/menaquinone biosynthesis C-methylase UbiE